MTRILYGNFDFEHELEDRSYRPSPRIAAFTAQLVPHLIALAADGDYLWNSADIPHEFLTAAAQAGLPEVRRCGLSDALSAESGDVPAQLVSEHWGWSAASIHAADKQKWRTVCPGPAATSHVNDRVFAAGLEAESGCGIPGSCLIRSHDELLDAIRLTAVQFKLQEDELQWVVKSRFGMASRGRICGTGTTCGPSAAGWLSRQFHRNTDVVFEPWVKCDREFSTQWVLPCRGGSPELLGWTEILNGTDGAPGCWNIRAAYPFAESEFQSALPMLTEAVNQIAAEGYFGPVGIDSMRYFDPGTHETAAVTTRGVSCHMRPLQDINGRYTMGRVALELAARICPGQDAFWLQLPATGICQAVNVGSQRQARDLYARQGLEISDSLRVADGKTVRLPDELRVWLTSPLWSDAAPSLRCGVLIAGPESAYLARHFMGIRP